VTTETEPGRAARDLQRLIEWRFNWALDLGFDLDVCERIAAAHCDMHELDRLVESGCPLDLAVAIVL
jgi:hypothetical protein